MAYVGFGAERSRKDGWNEGGIAICKFDEETPFFLKFIQLWFLQQATAQSSATTIGFTVIYHWGFLYITQLTVTM